MLRFDLKMVFIQCEYAAKNIMLDLSFPLGSWECGDARIRKYQSRITKQIKVLFSFLGEIDALSREPLFLQLQTIKNEWQSMAYNRDVWRSEIPYYRQKFISCVKQIKKIVNSWRFLQSRHPLLKSLYWNLDLARN